MCLLRINTFMYVYINGTQENTFIVIELRKHIYTRLFSENSENLENAFILRRLRKHVCTNF